MKKINHDKQGWDLADRLLRILETERYSKLPTRVTEPATREQLELLARLGIYPKWQATRHEADEMICNYRHILGSVNRIP